MPRVLVTQRGDLSYYQSDYLSDVTSECFHSFVLPMSLFESSDTRTEVRNPGRMYKGLDARWYYNTPFREPIIPTLTCGPETVNSVVHDKLLISDRCCKLTTDNPNLRWIRRYLDDDPGYTNIIGVPNVTTDYAAYSVHQYWWIREAETYIDDGTWLCFGDKYANKICYIHRYWFKGMWQGRKEDDSGYVRAIVYEDCHLVPYGNGFKVIASYAYQVESNKYRDVISAPISAISLPNREEMDPYFETVYPSDVEWLSYFDDRSIFDEIRVAQQPYQVTNSERIELITTALSNESMQVNNIGNIIAIKDLAVALSHPVRGIKAFLNSLKQCGKNPRSIANVAADGWLSYRYVYTTTLMDCKEIARCLRQARPDRMTYRDGLSRRGTDITCKVNFQNPEIARLTSMFDQLSAVGLAPDLYNLWDLVPYSFIVDWFTDIGDCLESITQYGRALKYDINYITIGAQRSFSHMCQMESGYISVPVHHYERFVTNQLPYFSYSGSFSLTSGKTIVKRIIDAISLMVS